ncbi:hypothetical protein CL657_01425 [bacterium]|nr:hypothetical protein [bacterium]|tara:strand:- start:3374 stop:3775 length:402 start_codon:yes stop_codon:yes gene_type:complete
MNNDYIICYDGVCNFCNFWVSLLIKYDKKKHFKYLWLQSQTATKLLANSTLTPADLNTIIYVRKGKIYTQSTAIIKIISDLKSFWIMIKLCYLIPKPIRDLVYKVIATVRYKLFGKQTSCQRPPVDQLDQFIS